jgi:DNA-directed RNA polymerase alpha subunit
MLDLYEAEEGEDEDDEVPAMSVSELGLSTRSRKCMERLQIQTVGELIRHTEDDLLSAPNFGRTSVAEVKSKLAELGLSLRSPEEGEEGEEPEEKLIEEHELIDDSAMKNLEDDEFEQ